MSDRARELIAEAESRGIRFVADGYRLRAFPKGALGPTLTAVFTEHREEILTELQRRTLQPILNAKSLTNAYRVAIGLSGWSTRGRLCTKCHRIGLVRIVAGCEVCGACHIPTPQAMSLSRRKHHESRSCL